MNSLRAPGTQLPSSTVFYHPWVAARTLEQDQSECANQTHSGLPIHPWITETDKHGGGTEYPPYLTTVRKKRSCTINVGHQRFGGAFWLSLSPWLRDTVTLVISTSPGECSTAEANKARRETSNHIYVESSTHPSNQQTLWADEEPRSA